MSDWLTLFNPLYFFLIPSSQSMRWLIGSRSWAWPMLCIDPMGYHQSKPSSVCPAGTKVDLSQSQKWQCTSCTFLNPATMRKCLQCQGRRDPGIEMVAGLDLTDEVTIMVSQLKPSRGPASEHAIPMAPVPQHVMLPALRGARSFL